MKILIHSIFAITFTLLLSCCSKDSNTSTVSIETIIHNGVLYSTVTSPLTGKVWLDRNIGATQVCAAIDDMDCYGGYYQWGRGSDGHQESTSPTTDVHATQISPVQADIFGLFVSHVNLPQESPYYFLLDWTDIGVDDNGSIRAQNWSKTDGTSVCPIDYRIPTLIEMEAEVMSFTNKGDAYQSIFKFPSAGEYNSNSGELYEQGISFQVWTTSLDKRFPSRSYHIYQNNSYSMFIQPSNSINIRSLGISIRCIKD